MKSFLILLNEKQPSILTNNLLNAHIDYLKVLSNKQNLVICGPSTDNKSAILIIRANTAEEAEQIIQNDPFITGGYYKNYQLNEFIEANKENDWLCSKLRE